MKNFLDNFRNTNAYKEYSKMIASVKTADDLGTLIDEGGTAEEYKPRTIEGIMDDIDVREEGAIWRLTIKDKQGKYHKIFGLWKPVERLIKNGLNTGDKVIVSINPDGIYLKKVASVKTADGNENKKWTLDKLKSWLSDIQKDAYDIATLTHLVEETSKEEQPLAGTGYYVSVNKMLEIKEQVIELQRLCSSMLRDVDFERRALKGSAKTADDNITKGTLIYFDGGDTYKGEYPIVDMEEWKQDAKDAGQRYMYKGWRNDPQERGQRNNVWVFDKIKWDPKELMKRFKNGFFDIQTIGL
jgi:hypothetical protein